MLLYEVVIGTAWRGKQAAVCNRAFTEEPVSCTLTVFNLERKRHIIKVTELQACWSTRFPCNSHTVS